MPAFGTGPFGLGVDLTDSAPPTGAAGCRYINPATKDFEQDPDTGQLKQMPARRQQVLVALTTAFGTASSQGGFGYRAPKKMGDQYANEVLVRVRTALRHLTDQQKVIRLDGVKTEKGMGGRSRITVSFTDISTGKADEVTINGR
jgi:hypothetical protein